MSPGKKLLYFAGSPGRFIKKQVAPGSVKSSMFSLVIICLGAGQITIPYTFYKLGFLGGCLAIAFGGGISIFASWMLAHACQMTNAASYEEVAMVSFGKSWQRGTSFSMVCANAGFLISYIVLFKSFMPYAIQTIKGSRLPSWCDDTLVGQIFWCILFSVFFVFPLSIPRELSALRFTSAFSVMVSFYIVLVICVECWMDHGSSPTVGQGFSRAHDELNIEVLTLFNCLPLIIFAFMYQINVPAIYNELKEKNVNTMKRVLTGGTIGASALYILCGIFGVVAFSTCGPEGYPMNF